MHLCRYEKITNTRIRHPLIWLPRSLNVKIATRFSRNVGLCLVEFPERMLPWPGSETPIVFLRDISVLLRLRPRWCPQKVRTPLIWVEIFRVYLLSRARPSLRLEHLNDDTPDRPYVLKFEGP